MLEGAKWVGFYDDEAFPMLWSDFHKRDITNMLYNIPVNSTYRIYVPYYDVTNHLNIVKQFDII